MGLISQATGAVYIRDSKPNGSDFSSALQARTSDPFSLEETPAARIAQGKPKSTGLGAAGFLSLHRTGQSFGLFQPNGTEVAKKGPGWRGVGGRQTSPRASPTRGSNTPNRRSADFIRPKGPCGTLFQLKIQFCLHKRPLGDDLLLFPKRNI